LTKEQGKQILALEENLRIMTNQTHKSNVKQLMEHEILDEHFQQLETLQSLCQSTQT